MKTLTIKELKELLKDIPDDMKVAVNCDISEDQDLPTRGKITSKSNAPYAKGDDVWAMYDLPDDEEVFFIR